MQQLECITISWFAMLASVSTAVFVFVGFESFVGNLSWLVVFLFVLYSYASFKLWRVTFAKRVSPLLMSFWLFNTNFLLLPALSQAVDRTFYWSSYDSYPQWSFLLACILVTVGLLSFEVGAIFAFRRMRQIKSCVTDASFFNSTIKLKWKLVIILILTFLTLIGFVLILGSEFFTSSRTSKLSQVESLPELGVLLSLPRALGLGVLFISISLIVQNIRDNRKITPAALVIFFVSLGLNSIVNFPFSVARFWVFGFLIGLIWIAIPLVSAGLRSAFVISMTVMQFTVLPMYSQITRGAGWIGVDIQSIRQYLHHGDFDGFQSIVNICLYIQENGFEFGRSLLSVVLFFIPRSIWENKAEPLGTAASEFMGYVYTNLSAPIYGELYADFGFVSLIFGMGFIGWGVAIADGYYDRLVRAGRFGVGVLLSGVLAGYLIILLRGSLLGVVPIIALLCGFIIIVCWLSANKTTLSPK